MSVFSSLTNRIFFATALLAVLSITIAIYIVNRAVTRQAERELQRSIADAAANVAETERSLFDVLGLEARLTAEAPYLKSAVDTHDPNTVRPIAVELQNQLAKADLFVITDRNGQVLARLGTSTLSADALAAITRPHHGNTIETSEFSADAHGILLIRSVPIRTDPRAPDTLGTLILGTKLDDAQAQRLKSLTDSDIAFGMNGRIEASTLPPDTWPTLAPLLGNPSTSAQRIPINGEDYFAFTNVLGGPDAVGKAMSIVLRSQTDRVRFLQQLHTELIATAVFAVLLATLLSYGIARTVTRPVEAVTSTMREMAASGDLTRRIPVPADARWHDEDARLLASTFNAMTDAILRFQREATQRERLSSLGRLSTVIAHEIRNPLMIIKTSLRPLRRDDATSEQMKTAARDIDEEITRLNRIVTEVLDFARPIKFELASADLNALAEDAVRAATPDGHGQVRIDLDRSIPPITTDAERLRQALVNILGNAQQAVSAKGTPAGNDAVHLTTAAIDRRRVAVTIADRGVGIPPEDLPRVFDPYFTTRRTGTGIGLAITRNIIEGLGGRISVSSERDRGTEVRIELPVDADARHE